MFSRVLRWLFAVTEPVTRLLYKAYKACVPSGVSYEVFHRWLYRVWLPILSVSSFIITFRARYEFRQVFKVAFTDGPSPHRTDVLIGTYNELNQALNEVGLNTVPAAAHVTTAGWFGVGVGVGMLLVVLGFAATLYYLYPSAESLTKKAAEVFMKNESNLYAQHLVADKIKVGLFDTRWERPKAIKLESPYKGGAILKLDHPHTKVTLLPGGGKDVEVYFDSGEWMPADSTGQTISGNGVVYRMPTTTTMSSAPQVPVFDSTQPWIKPTKLEIPDSQLRANVTTYVMVDPNKVTQLLDGALDGCGGGYHIDAPEQSVNKVVNSIFTAVAKYASESLGVPMVSAITDTMSKTALAGLSVSALVLGISAYFAWGPAAPAAAIPGTMAALLPPPNTYVTICDQTTAALIRMILQDYLPSWIVPMSSYQEYLVDVFMEQLKAIDNVETAVSDEIKKVIEEGEKLSKMGFFGLFFAAARDAVASLKAFCMGAITKLTRTGFFLTLVDGANDVAAFFKALYIRLKPWRVYIIIALILVLLAAWYIYHVHMELTSLVGEVEGATLVRVLWEKIKKLPEKIYPRRTTTPGAPHPRPRFTRLRKWLEEIYERRRKK